HRPGGEYPALSGTERPPGVSPALGHGGVSYRAHATSVCLCTGHAPGHACRGEQSLTPHRACGDRAQNRRRTAVRGRTDQSGAGVRPAQEQEDGYDLTGPLPPLAIPATLHDALMARLDRLAAAKLVAQLGAVIGRTFAYDLVQAVAPMDAATL